MNRILSPLQGDYEIGAHVISAPKVLVRIGYNERWSWAVMALIDTGSPVTFIAPDLAKDIGWMQPEGEPAINLGGYGGNEPKAGWREIMHVSFVESHSQEPMVGLVLEGSVVFVSELAGRGSVVIGQHDALERLRFLQRNQEPYWDFALSRPDAEEP